MKWSIAILVVMGLIAAVSASVLISAVRAGGLESLMRRKQVNSEVEVLVAARDIPAMSTIDLESFRIKKVLSSEAPADHLAEPVQVIGEVLSVPMLDGQVFTRHSFAPNGSGLKLAASLEEGMRAVSLSLTDHSGLYGLLYPGSVVDVIATFKQRAEKGQRADAVSLTLLRGIQVIGIEDRTVVSSDEGESSNVGDAVRQRNRRWMVTLTVKPIQAQLVQLALEYGTVSLAMCNPFDSEKSLDTQITSLNSVVRNPAGARSESAWSRVLSGAMQATEGHFTPARSPSSHPSAPGTSVVPADYSSGTEPPTMARHRPPSATSATPKLKPRPEPYRELPIWELQVYRAGSVDTVEFLLPEVTNPTRPNTESSREEKPE